MPWLKKVSSGLVLLFLHTSLSATTYKPAIQFSYALLSSEPASLNGFQLFWQWQQPELCWRRFQVIFDIGLSHFEHSQPEFNNQLTIISASPVLRYHFKPYANYQLYLDLSIGAAYLNQTQMQDRNLGMHFAFQDRFGLGLLFGNKNQYSVGMHAVHYSNASLSRNNSGISIPLMVDFSIVL